MNKVACCGVGFVGTAVSTCLQNIAEVREHDKYKDTESLDSVVNNSDIIFICLPTPMQEDGSCDTSIVENEIDNICRIARKPKSIVIKSTVTPGTTDKLQKKYKKDVFGLMKLDERIGKSHLSVPGPDGKRGFGGSCFVKDLNALSTFAKELDLDPMVLDSVWTKNLLVREEYEWEQLAQVTGEYKKNEV